MHLTHCISTYHMMTKDYQGHARSPCSRNPPSADDKNLEGCLPGPQLAHKYAKHLHKKVQVDSSVSQEPEIIPDPESATDTQY